MLSSRKGTHKSSMSYRKSSSIFSNPGRMSMSHRMSISSATIAVSTPADVKKQIQTSLLEKLRVVQPNGVPKPLDEELTAKVEAFLKTSNENFIFKRLNDEELAEKREQKCKDFSSTFGESIKKARSLINDAGLKLPPEGVICLSSGQTRRNGGVPVYYFFSPPDVQQFKWATDGTLLYEPESGRSLTIRVEKADDLSVLMYKRTHGDSAVFVVQNEPKGGLKQYATGRTSGVGVFCNPPIKKIVGHQVRVLDFQPDTSGNVQFAEVAFANDGPDTLKGFIPAECLKPFIDWTTVLYKLQPTTSSREVVLLQDPPGPGGKEVAKMNESGISKLTLTAGVLVDLLKAKDGYSNVNVQSEGGPRGHRASVMGRSGWVKSSLLLPFNGDSRSLAKYGVALDKSSSKCKKCKLKFNLTRPRRNCRVCGGAFCKKCSPRNVTVGGHANKPICIDCDAARNKDTKAAYAKIRAQEEALARAMDGASDAEALRRKAIAAAQELEEMQQQLLRSKRKVKGAEEELRQQKIEMDRLRTEKEDALDKLKSKEQALAVAQKTLKSSAEGRLRRLAQAEQDRNNLEQESLKMKKKFKKKYKELTELYNDAEGTREALEEQVIELEEQNATDKETLEASLADALAESESLSNNLATSQKSLAKMKAQLDSGNKSATKQLSDEIAQLKSSAIKVEAAKQDTAKRLGEATRKLKSAQQQLDAAKMNHVGKLEALQDKLKAVAKMNASTDAELVKLQEEKDAMQKKMRGQIEELGTKIDELSGELKGLEEEKASLSKEIRKLKVDFAEERLKLTNQALKNLSNASAKNGADVDMQVKLRLAENQVSKANAKKDEIKARLTALKKSSTNKQKQLEGEIERVSAQTATLKTELASERKKVSGLENELEVTKKEIVHTTKGPGLFRTGDEILSTKKDGLRKGKRGKLIRFDEAKSKWLVKWNNVKTPGFYQACYMKMLDPGKTIGPKKGFVAKAEDAKQLRRQLDEFRQSEAKMSRELVELAEQLDKVKAERDELQKRVKAIVEGEMEALKKQLAARKRGSTAEVTELNKQLGQLEKSQSELTQELKLVKTEKAKLLEEKMMLAQEKLDLKTELSSGSSKANLLIEEQTRLQAELTAALQAREQADSLLIKMKTENSTLEYQLSGLNNQMSSGSSKALLDEAHQEIDVLKNKLDDRCCNKCATQ